MRSLIALLLVTIFSSIDLIAQTPAFKSYSQFDFVPREKVVAFADFSQAAIGDFPAKWNSKGSGDVVTVEGLSGRWLQLNDATLAFPEFIKNLPENFTLEFNLAANPDPCLLYTSRCV